MLDTQNQTLVTIACVHVNVIAPDSHFGILGNLTTLMQSMPQVIEHIVRKKSDDSSQVQNAWSCECELLMAHPCTMLVLICINHSFSWLVQIAFT
jgi:hypothetical protein